MNEFDKTSELDNETVEETANQTPEISEKVSGYSEKRYGVSYSPDAKGEYSDSAYGAYPECTTSSENKEKDKGKSKNSISAGFLAVIAAICVAAALFGGVAGAYITAKHSYQTPNESQINDLNGDIQMGDTTAVADGSNGDSTSAPNEVIGNISINESNNSESMPTEFTAIVARTLNSVVEIRTESVEYSQWNGQYVVTGAGSGVIISVDNEDPTVYYIVTNHHVIDGAEDIRIRLNSGKEYVASLIATDAITDVALLSIKVNEGVTLTVAEMINADVKLLDGQDIYVIGNPLGSLGGSVAKGIISKTARQIYVSGVKMNLMQIDAAVNPGNSGGGLFDMYGRLIGVVNAKYSDEGIEGLGFAIPIATVKHVVSQLAEYGYVTGRAGLGLSLVDENYSTGGILSSTTVTYPTVSIDSNVSGTYTGTSGETETFTFKKGDIIFGINGTTVNSTAALLSYLTEFNVNDTVQVSVYRQVVKVSGNREYYTTEEYTVTVVLTEYVPIL